MKTDIYQMITDKMIEQLENGKTPWHKPWDATVGGAISHGSGKPYSLINQFILGRDGEWLTFKEVEKEGGHIRKGEKASFVVFWKRYEIEEENEEGEKVVKTIPVLRFYNVFHISQVDGVQPKFEGKEHEVHAVAKADEIVAKYFERETVKLLNEKESDRAFYAPGKDIVNVPTMKQYADTEEYYSTLFHEMVHSTGHKSRLARPEVMGATFFGSCDYSREELVAEMGAAFLCAQAGIDGEKVFNNSAAYLRSWLRALKNDKKMIVFAASRAEAAARYILDDIEEGGAA